MPRDPFYVLGIVSLFIYMQNQMGDRSYLTVSHAVVVVLTALRKVL